jgi:hypothetical protein
MVLTLGVENVEAGGQTTAEILLDPHHHIVADFMLDQHVLVGEVAGRGGLGRAVLLASDQIVVVAGTIQARQGLGAAGACAGEGIKVGGRAARLPHWQTRRNGARRLIGIGREGPLRRRELALIHVLIAQHNIAVVPIRAPQETTHEVICTLHVIGLSIELQAVEARTGDEVNHAGHRI